MKVFTYGNVLNNAFNMTRFLRAKGVDAEMFLDDSVPAAQNYPQWEQPRLAIEGYPEWIHYHHLGAADIIRASGRFRQMAREFSRCDIALTCSWGPILARAANIPSVFYSFGGDLLVAHTRRELQEVWHRSLAGMRPGVRGLALGIRQRRALDHVDAIGILMGYQVNNYVKPLGLLPKSVRLRLAWPIEEYAARPDPEITRKYAGFEIVYFMVARHTWRSVWNDWKGNDKFIRAFARFVRESRPNVRLVCIEKGVDVDGSKRLIDELGIAEYVEWVPEMNKDRIRAYLALPNGIVVDQFWHDECAKRFPADGNSPRIGFGSGTIEAMGAGRPVITTFFDHDFYDGESPPILRAYREDEILEALRESLRLGAEGRRALGEHAHDFVMRYHDWNTTTDLYIRLLEGVHRARHDGKRYMPPETIR